MINPRGHCPNCGRNDTDCSGLGCVGYTIEEPAESALTRGAAVRLPDGTTGTVVARGIGGGYHIDVQGTILRDWTRDQLEAISTLTPGAFLERHGLGAAPLSCQCDIPGIVECDMHGPTE